MSIEMKLDNLSKKIFEYIGQDKLETAIDLMSDIFQGSNKLSEIIHQSGRLNALKNRIREGTITHEEINVDRNKIRLAIIDLLNDMDELSREDPVFKNELEAADEKNIIQNSKNVVIGGFSNVTGNIHIGDRIQPKNGDKEK